MNRKQKGLNLIMAIFLILIIAGIGVFMFNIANVQRQTSTLSILSSRARFAADSAIQWGIYSVLQTSDCSAFPASFNLTASGGTSNDYAVSLTCTRSSHTENPDTYNVYRLTATASMGSPGDPAYISRVLRTTVTDAP